MAEDYADQVKQFNNNRGAPPEPVKVIVPYMYATVHAAATFLASVLLGRRPIFPLMATGGTVAQKTSYMEQALQANIEASKGYEASGNSSGIASSTRLAWSVSAGRRTMARAFAL
jgi:hypothetical protein